MNESKKTQSKKQDNIIDGLGKLPPQVIELEEAVLGALLLEKDALVVISGVLRPESFYKEAHQKIFKAVVDLFDKSEPIDILTVTNQLRIKGELEIVGGAFYVTELTSKVNSAANIEFHARIISETAMKRELIAFGSDLCKDGYEDTIDAFDLLNDLSNKVYRLEANYFSKDTQTILSLSKKVMEEVQRASEKKDGITGEISGIQAIDEYTKGFGKQDLVIIAARPGMGKSSLVHTMIRNRAVDHGKPTALFTLEMSSTQATKVLHSHQTGIDHQKLKDGKLEEHEWALYHSKIQPLLESPIYMDDTPSISITEIRAKSRRLVSKFGVSLIIVDYLQLATAGFDKNKRNNNREQEISEISRGLKALAKELDVPVIALAQLSRASESRSNKLPQLSDLRDSGAIEQDADMVMFLFRPAYYGMTEDEAGNTIPKHLTKAIVAKYREGDLGDIDLRFIGRIKKFDSNPYGGHEDLSSAQAHNIPIKSPSFFDNANADDFENNKDEPF